MKHILLFGAGKSSAVLIDYLKEITVLYQWQATVADGNGEAALKKVGKHNLVHAVQLNIENEAERKKLVQHADVVISLMPPFLHYLIALDCVHFGKHLLTASYTDEKIKALAPEIMQKNILFLCEMGLDPGIDHMSAMQLIHRVKKSGGNIISFKSHCGGLVAPESDYNPWHYKISWNPQNIIRAGKDGAAFKEDGTIKKLSYEEVFAGCKLVEGPSNMSLAYYPNRDSLSYIPLYNLEEAKTFIRTTLRHPDFCFGWKNIIDLKLTDETPAYNTNGMTIAEFFKIHFEKHDFSGWLNSMLSSRLSYAKDLIESLTELLESKKEEPEEEVMLAINEDGELDTWQQEDSKDITAAEIAKKMHEANLCMKQLFFLGLDSNEKINLGFCSAARVLQFLMEKKLSLEIHDKDMVVMMHELEYEIDGIKKGIRAILTVKGRDNVHTAMAKTVGLPLGIAARLIMEGKLTETGLHIPTLPSIYNPILKELEAHGIKFHERSY